MPGGWGSKKKHRGAGSRGGRGNAGSGKRADVKKPSYWKDLKYFGRHGFTSKHKDTECVLTIHDLNRHCDLWLAEGKVKMDGDKVQVNLAELGFTKLLGNNMPLRKYVIVCTSASAGAVEKIKNAGGTVTTA